MIQRIMLIIFAGLFFQAANGQGARICETGTSGSAVNYSATFLFPLGNNPQIEWSVQNGYISSQSTTPGYVAASIIWSGSGTISVIDKETGQTASLNTTYTGGILCAITPGVQSVLFGQAPCILTGPQLCAGGGRNGFPPHTYQWQESSADVLSYTDIPGATAQDYQPPAFSYTLYPGKAYRRKTIVSGVAYYSNDAYVNLYAVSAGVISATTTSINYNTKPAIQFNLAALSYCSPFPNGYSYTWQQSVNNGPWTDIGTGAAYPSSAPNLLSGTRIRRRVTGCSGEYYYSNILNFTVNYTSPNQENLNYVRENTVTIKGVLGWEQADQLATGQKFQSTSYLDGMGRGIQTVSKETSLTGGVTKDIVQPAEYDDLGRQVKGYLAYPSSTNAGKFKPLATAVSEQGSYYSTALNETHAYSRSVFDNSPLNKVVTIYKPGASWNGANAGSTQVNSVNDASENIKMWDIGYQESSVPSVSGVYPTGSLAKLTITDDAGKKTVQYADIEGKVVFTKVQKDNNPGSGYTGWICTYNVYDDLGRLRYIISPKAVDYLEANSWPALNTVNGILNELCTKYFYDKRGRLILKKVSGKVEEAMVYDNRDRLVLYQDGNLKSHQQWMFYLYDSKDRQLANGVFDKVKTRNDFQTYVDQNLANTDVTITAQTNISEQLIAYNPVVGQSQYCDNCSNVKYHALNYMDNYNYNGAKAFNNSVTLAYDPYQDENIELTKNTGRIMGLSTGSKIVILGNTQLQTFLTTTTYYNDKGALLQATTDNHIGGTNEITFQYDFAGKTVSTYSKHTATGMDVNSFDALTKYSFDVLGRTIEEAVNYNGNGYNTMSTYEYNELGQIKKKKTGLSPISGGSEIEFQDYAYNIHGQLTGINKDYALKTGGLYNKWQHGFGMYIGYDNRDAFFAKAELNGNITGTTWTTQGDDAQRKYDFYYDNLNQLSTANFTEKQKVNDAWNTAKYDFSASTTYDINGNIKTLMHKGVAPGIAPMVTDQLSYTYKNIVNSIELSNRLDKVVDQAATSVNGMLNDFKDGSNSNSDYDYDDNGNLLYDLNKNITGLNSGVEGIKYNMYDKVEEIKIPAKGTVQYIYDATGNKLKKIFTPVSGTAKITDYTGECIYTNNELQYVSTSEGRLRVITPYSNGTNMLQGNFMITSTKALVHDYFIKDNLGNTRVVLTEEVQKDADICQGETGTLTHDKLNFGQLTPAGTPAPANEVEVTRIATPAAWKYDVATNPQGVNTTDHVFGLKNIVVNGKTYSMGPNRFLKVMAGDVVKAGSKYYYAANPGQESTSTILGDLAGSFVNAFYNGQASTIAKNNQLAVQSGIQGSGNLPSFLTYQGNEGVNTTPKAYLNCVFMDEQFNYIEGYAKRVSDPGNIDHSVLTPVDGVKAPKNGYVFVFLSNESPTTMVYFDNFWVQHERGRIVEEDHYYPYGLKIEGISSRKLGAPGNQNGMLANYFGYQGIYSEEDDFTGWNEFNLRNYDPQIGRWTGVDPYDEFDSPYIGMGNNPVFSVDPDGGRTITAGELIGAGVGAAAVATAAYLFAKNNSDNDWVKGGLTVLGAFVGAGFGYASVAVFTQDGNFWKNMRAFYEGLFDFDGSKEGKQIGNRQGIACGSGSPAYVPRVWIFDFSKREITGGSNHGIVSIGDFPVDLEFTYSKLTLPTSVLGKPTQPPPGNVPPRPPVSVTVSNAGQNFNVQINWTPGAPTLDSPGDLNTLNNFSNANLGPVPPVTTIGRVNRNGACFVEQRTVTLGPPRLIFTQSTDRPGGAVDPFGVNLLNQRGQFLRNYFNDRGIPNNRMQTNAVQWGQTPASMNGRFNKLNIRIIRARTVTILRVPC